MSDTADWPWSAPVAGAAVYRTSYVPKTLGEIKLNHNEAPDDLDADLKAEILLRLGQLPWHRYADPDASRTCEALARHTGHLRAGIAVGHGANELISRLMFAIAPATTVVLVDPDYYVHGRAALLAGHKLRRVALLRRDDKFILDIQGIIEAAGAGPALLILSQPNNPTGSLFDAVAVDQLLDQFPGAVVLDEAYAEFSGVTRQAELATRPNLAILRTMSKAFALAGARIGYLLASPEFVTNINKLQPPYPVSEWQGVAAEVVLAHPERAAQRVEAVRVERQRLQAGLRALGVETLDSYGNFVLAVLAQRRPAVLAALLQAELAVRDVGDLPSAAGCLRLSVGAPAANDRLLAALQAGLGG